MSRKKKILLVILAIIALLPIRMTCGHLLYACVTAPDPNGYYYTYYEVEPLGVTVIETLIQTNLRIYYWSGEQEHIWGSS